MLGVLAWHGLAAFGHTGTWQDIATVLEAAALLAALLLWFRAD